MTREMIEGIVRHLATTLGGVLTTKGWIDESGATALVGLAVALAGFVASLLAKRKAATPQA